LTVGLARSSYYYAPAGERPENLRLMGLEALYPKRRLSQLAIGQRIYQYLLHPVLIGRPNQVWKTDITYIRLRQGFGRCTLNSRPKISWFKVEPCNPWPWPDADRRPLAFDS
jgi:hypothetical protein